MKKINLLQYFLLLTFFDLGITNLQAMQDPMVQSLLTMLKQTCEPAIQQKAKKAKKTKKSKKSQQPQTVNAPTVITEVQVFQTLITEMQASGSYSASFQWKNVKDVPSLIAEMQASNSHSASMQWSKVNNLRALINEMDGSSSHSASFSFEKLRQELSQLK